MFFAVVAVFVGLGFEIRASHLQSMYSTALAMPLAHFALVIWKWSLVDYLPRFGLKP
jgi:predicted membrane protein